MKKTVLIALALAGVALAATQSLTLVLNGKISSKKAISVNGETYVPLSSLTALGIKVSSASGTVSLTSGSSVATSVGNSSSSGAGGANQKASVSGCQNEWLFNGIWRLRVTKLEVVADPDRPGKALYQVTSQLSNGTTQTLTPDSGGIYYLNAYNLAFDDGDSIAAYGGAIQDKTYARMPQGSSALLVLNFVPTDGKTLEEARAKLPRKFLFEVNAERLDKSLKLGFTVKDPSFRVDLTCKK